MRHSFVPLLSTAIILMSMSDCDPKGFSRHYAPVSAEINGVLYADEMAEISSDYPDMPTYIVNFSISENGFTFDTSPRKLTAESNHEIQIEFDSSGKTGTLGISTGIEYTIKARLTEGHATWDTTDGYIRFISFENQRITGEFEFNVNDPDTKKQFIT